MRSYFGQLLKERDVTVAQVSRATGIHRHFLNKLKKERPNIVEIPVLTLFRLRKYFNKKTEEIIWFEELDLEVN